MVMTNDFVLLKNRGQVAYSIVSEFLLLERELSQCLQRLAIDELEQNSSSLT